jgi:hypothetical protein
MSPEPSPADERGRIEDRATTVVRLLLAAGALVVLWGLLSSLPGVERLVPVADVSYAAVIGAVMTVAVVAVLLAVAVVVQPLAFVALSGPTDLVAAAASIARHLVLFVAVLVAHAGLKPLFEPTLAATDFLWVYDLLFLALALVPTLIVAARTFGNVTPVANLVTERLPLDGEQGSQQPE